MKHELWAARGGVTGIKWPYEPMEWYEIEQEIPLNARQTIVSRMRDMTNEQLARVITAAGILFWETAEQVGMIACLYTACELERTQR